MIKIEDGILFKYCTGCNKYLPYTSFYVSKSSKYDGLNWQCKDCGSTKARLRHHDYYERECSRLKEYQRIRRLNTPLKEKQEYNKEYRKKHYEEILEKERQYGKKRRKILGTDPIYRLNNNIGKGIWESLKHGKEGSHWESLVGYTLNRLREHLEIRFTDGMSWKNYGKGEGKWCVDHTKPIIAFNIISPECREFIECWALPNLRPMWSIENSGKSGLYEGVRIKRKYDTIAK